MLDEHFMFLCPLLLTLVLLNFHYWLNLDVDLGIGANTGIDAFFIIYYWFFILGTQNCSCVILIGVGVDEIIEFIL